MYGYAKQLQYEHIVTSFDVTEGLAVFQSLSVLLYCSTGTLTGLFASLSRRAYLRVRVSLTDNAVVRFSEARHANFAYAFVKPGNRRAK